MKIPRFLAPESRQYSDPKIITFWTSKIGNSSGVLGSENGHFLGSIQHRSIHPFIIWGDPKKRPFSDPKTPEELPILDVQKGDHLWVRILPLLGRPKSDIFMGFYGQKMITFGTDLRSDHTIIIWGGAPKMTIF